MLRQSVGHSGIQARGGQTGGGAACALRAALSAPLRTGRGRKGPAACRPPQGTALWTASYTFSPFPLLPAPRNRQRTWLGLPTIRPDNVAYMVWGLIILVLDLTYSAFVVRG